MTIRQVVEQDAAEISTLSIESVLPYKDLDFDKEGWQRFIGFTNPQATRERIAHADYLMFCYLAHKKIRGLITLCQYEKIDQLFVHPDFCSRGIASKLWCEARKACIDKNPRGTFWLRSSSMAVPIYKKWGFEIVSKKQILNGIAFTLMEAKLV